MSNRGVKKVPPDGGYGWVVTFAYALNNVVVLPLIAGFGLVFQEAFAETNLSATQGTLVITLNHGIGMLLSFFGGPLLRRFGYRKVAAVGAILIVSGLVLTAFASSFWVFILSYSIINSMGIAAVMAAFTLAINSFFKEKRGRAVGIGMSITGLGPIYMPLLMSFLINSYGWRNAVLILGAMCLHSLVAATLLRPIKWYLKETVISEEMVPLNKDSNVELINSSMNEVSKENGVPSLPCLESPKENGVSPTKSVSMKALTSSSNIDLRNTISHPDLSKKFPELPQQVAQIKWWEPQEINLGSSINIFSEADKNKNKNKVKEVPKEEDDQTITKTIVQKFIDFFDLTLLKDPVFVNILIGLSMAGCVETNFSLLFPIILKDLMQFETGEIAQLMAIIGFSDTLFRLVSPFIGEWCHKPPRVMYMIALLMIIFTRCIMLFTTTYMGMLFVAIAIGITKGVRTVYVNIVIPTYVPIERLPFASSIQMFVNGIFIISIGSLLGRIRELSGSYVIPIMVLNVVTLLTVILWTGEFLYFKWKKQPIKETMAA